MNLQKAVAMRICKLLIAKNMTQYALSVKSGLTKQAISNIINEKYESIKFDTIYKLADGFGISINEFIDDECLQREKLDLK